MQMNWQCLSLKQRSTLQILPAKGVLEFGNSQDIQFLTDLQKSFRGIRVIGPELILGRLFEEVGYHQIKEQLFRHLVITRLVYPGRKLKTVEYLWQYKGCCNR